MLAPSFEAACDAVSDGLAPALLTVAPGFTGSAAFEASFGLAVALGSGVLLPVEPGLAGADPGFPAVSSGRSLDLPRSSTGDVTGVSSLSFGLASAAAVRDATVAQARRLPPASSRCSARARASRSGRFGETGQKRILARLCRNEMGRDPGLDQG
ncbi:hypothetical protein GCM10007884_28170 [Methylobacterium brachythecii]|uniref:Amidase domain-containing protein n=1 Tax=Methylobacterium brachythecii TaxID=1176177 RepID=A0ABQ6D958_9HYPH|nr:hypothetical protein GCM10007884_28170 [Methylobacterium brachythecii]